MLKLGVSGEVTVLFQPTANTPSLVAHRMWSRCWRWWSRGGRRRASSRRPRGARPGCCRPDCSSAPARRSALPARPVFIISFTKCFNPAHYSVRFVVLALESTTCFGNMPCIRGGTPNPNKTPTNAPPIATAIISIAFFE